MDMEPNKIKQLLEKYYEGITSIEEDQVLKDYFQNQSVPSELETDKELFTYTSLEAKTLPIGSQLEQKLIKWIDNQESDEKKIRRLSWGYRISGIVATAAVVLICYLTIFKPKKEIMFKDTYDNPQVAYAEAKKALLYISKQLNKGTKPLSQVGKLNAEMDKLSSISSLNDGLTQLELISKYSKSQTENNKTK
jgi:hypothetical protein